jgi:hypothetical protein
MDAPAMMEVDLRLRVVVVPAPVAREAVHHTMLPRPPITLLVADTSSKATQSQLPLAVLIRLDHQPENR